MQQLQSLPLTIGPRRASQPQPQACSLLHALNSTATSRQSP